MDGSGVGLAVTHVTQAPDDPTDITDITASSLTVAFLPTSWSQSFQ